jgi:hypothetical protein
VAIAFDSFAETTDTDGGTFAINQPSGVAAGKCAIIFVNCYDQNGGTITPPTGFALYQRLEVSQAHNWSAAVYGKVLAGGDSFTITVPANYTDVVALCYSGTHATTPLVDTGTANQGTGTTVTGTGVTVTTADSVLFAAMSGYTTGLSVGFGGMTLRGNANFDASINWYDETVAAGATGNRTATLAASDEWGVVMGVIAPAAGGGGVVATVDHTSTLSFPALCRKPRRDDGRWTRGRCGLWERKAA